MSARVAAQCWKSQRCPMYHLEVGDLSPESSLLRQVVSSICARSSFPLDIVFQLLLYEPNPFQHIGDVIYSSFLHLQQYIIRQICPETTAAVLEKGRLSLPQVHQQLCLGQARHQALLLLNLRTSSSKDQGSYHIDNCLHHWRVQSSLTECAVARLAKCFCVDQSQLETDVIITRCTYAHHCRCLECQETLRLACLALWTSVLHLCLPYKHYCA